MLMLSNFIGGTAGVTVAGRLSETDATVLVLEAGGKPEDSGLPYRVPSQTAKLWGTPLDWNFTTQPETYLNNRELNVNRGKALGGTSAINGLTYGRGSASMHNAINKIIGGGWSWEDNLPYFEKVS